MLPPDPLQRVPNDRIALRAIGEVVAQAVCERVGREWESGIDGYWLSDGSGKDGGSGEGGPGRECGREGGERGGVVLLGGTSKLGAVEVILLAIATECLCFRS